MLEKRREWDLHLCNASWSYRTTFKASTQFTPFQLTYRHEAIMPIELEIRSLRTTLTHAMRDEGSYQARLMILEKLDESRESALSHNRNMHHNTKFNMIDCTLW